MPWSARSFRRHLAGEGTLRALVADELGADAAALVAPRDRRAPAHVARWRRTGGDRGPVRRLPGDAGGAGRPLPLQLEMAQPEVASVRRLRRSFFARPSPTVAPDLLNKLLVAGGSVGRIVEVEAYMADDPASHAFRGPTRRNATMFGKAGRAVRLLHLRHAPLRQRRHRNGRRRPSRAAEGGHPCGGHRRAAGPSARSPRSVARRRARQAVPGVRARSAPRRARPVRHRLRRCGSATMACHRRMRRASVGGSASASPSSCHGAGACHEVPSHGRGGLPVDPEAVGVGVGRVLDRTHAVAPADECDDRPLRPVGIVREPVRRSPAPASRRRSMTDRRSHRAGRARRRTRVAARSDR